LREVTSGIYQIRQKSTGRKYLGRTVDFVNRKCVHFAGLNSGKHHNPHLQNAWKKYGAEDFTFEILEIVAEKSYCQIREQWHLDNSVVWGFDFNTSKSSVSPTMTGMTHTPETKAKMSAAKLKMSPETKAKMSATNLGRTRTPETKAKISAANLGRKHTPETKAKMSATRLKMSPETKAKMSESAKMRKATPEARANMSATKLKMSPETKAKMSANRRKTPLETAARFVLVQENSGLSVQKFCEQNDVNYSYFNSWKYNQPAIRSLVERMKTGAE